MRFLVSVGALLLSLGRLSLAQDAPLPKPETQDAAPAASPGPNPSLSTSPPPELIPPDVLSPADRAASSPLTAPSAPPIPQLDESFAQKSMGAAADTARLHAEWRDLKNRVANNPEIKAAARFAEKATTDLERRKLLRKYYEIYFDKMLALAPSPETKAYLNDRKNEQLNALLQPRVRPSPTPSKPAS